MLVSKLNLILQPYMSWQIQILMFLTGLEIISDHIWQIISLVSEIWKWWIMVPKESLQFMLLMEQQIVTRVFSVWSETWYWYHKDKKLKNKSKFVLVLGCSCLDVEDKLCNGATKGTVKYIHIHNTTSSAKDGRTIYVQFDSEKSGNKRKSNSLSEELKSCVPMLEKASKFS